MSLRGRGRNGLEGAGAAGNVTYLYPSGGTSDQTAINAAITAAPVGGVVELLGQHVISAPVIIDRSYVTLRTRSTPCTGGYVRPWNGTLGSLLPGTSPGLKCNAAGFNAIEIRAVNVPDDGETRHRGIKIENLYLLGAGDSIGIYNTSVSHDMCRITNCLAHRFAAGADVNLDSVVIDQYICQDCTSDGLRLAGINGSVTNYLIYDIGGHGIVLTGADPNVGIGKIGDTNLIATKYAVYINGATGAIVEGVQANNTSGIATVGGSDHTLVGNKFRASGGYLIGTTASPSTNVTIVGNSLDSGGNTAAYAVEFVGASWGTVNGNSFRGGFNSGGTATVKWNDACKVANNSGDVSVATIPALSSGTVIAAFSANDQAGFLLDGNTITSQLNRQGTGTIGNLVNSSAPLVKINQVNGNAVMRFDGTDDNLKNTSTPGTLSQAFYVLVVMKQAATTGTQTPVSFASGNASLYISGGTANLYAGSPVAGASLTGTNWNIVEALFSGAASFTRVNGGAKSVISAGTAGGGGNFFIGSNAGGASEFFNGDIETVIVVSGTPADADTAMLRQIYAQKNKITIAA